MDKSITDKTNSNSPLGVGGRTIQPADRLNSVSEYYFSTKLKEVAEMNAKGLNVISLGIGSPDMPPSAATVEALCTSAADPAVLLLDEITANLDVQTEARVLEALRRASAGRTVISISHRIYEQLGGRMIEIRALDGETGEGEGRGLNPA